MIRTFRLSNSEDLDENDPWTGILSAVAFATRATSHTTLNATPTQLVFGRDHLIGASHTADWCEIKQRKQEQETCIVQSKCNITTNTTYL